MKRILFFLAILIILMFWAAPAAAQDDQATPLDRRLAEGFLQIPGLWDWTIGELAKLDHNGPFLVIYYEQLCRYCYDHKLLTWVQDNAPAGVKVVLILHPSHRPHDLKNIQTVLSLYFDALILPEEFREAWDGFCERHKLGKINALFVAVDGQGRVVDASYFPKHPDHMAWLKKVLAELAGGDSDEK